jgi:hypothetical protein
MQRIALLACVVLLPCLADADSLRFQFRLDNDYSTSAGAFDASGTLVRTLWSNRRYTAGVHDAAWDGRNDDGQPVREDADYEIRLLTHNVIYTWDGVIGNTSPDPTSPVHHDAPHFFADLVVSGDRAFFTTPGEGPVPTMRYFRLDDPHSWHGRPTLPVAYDARMTFVAADRERVYWAHESSPWSHTWGKGGDQAFVMATDRDLTREILFDEGAPACVERVGQACYRDDEVDRNIRSAIDVVDEFRENPATPVLEGARNNVTGLAVQLDGPLLFVAHGALSPAQIHVLDKRSGRLLARVPLAGVGRLVAVQGRDELWAIHDGEGGRVVSHLALGPAPDYALKVVRTLTGLESPLALSLAPDGSQVVVDDGGSSQQVRAFDTGTGAPLWQLGEKGGYAVHGPAVSTDKFSFHGRNDPQTAQRTEQALLAFAPDGSFWLGDPALGRLLEFDKDRRYVDQIAFRPVFYTLAVDRNDPSRVFAEYSEYAVDYSKPLDRAWRLVRFFGDSPRLTMDHRQYGTGFIDVATLGNGRTYGLARTVRGGVEVMEVPKDGDLRRFPLKLQQPVLLDENGDLYAARANQTGRVETWRRALTGFDSDGSPLWGHEQIRARVTRGARDPRVNNANTFERNVAPLDPDLNVIFDAGNSDAGRFHLGAIRNDGSGWLWRASPSSGEFDLSRPDGVFDASHPWYAGMQVSTLGDQIVYNYHGEGWHNDGQANQFLHWYRDGLFVGQFGVPRVRGIPPSAPGMAGNSFSIQLVTADGQIYLWHNDENAHAGVHRWHLDGIEWMREMKGRGRLEQKIDLAAAAAADTVQAGRVAPTDLVAQAQPGIVRLTWRRPTSAADGIEVQRLQPTYVGPRFERIATLPGSATSFVDNDPLYGEPTVYRVRALLDGSASDYSNHVHLTAAATAVVLESQSFEKAPPGMGDAYRRQNSPDVDIDVIADPGSPGNRVMHIRARRPSGAKEFGVRPRWTASPQLFAALNASVGRPRGDRADIYRVQFDLRLLQAHLTTGSTVSVQVDPGQNLFATSGRQQDLMALAGLNARVGRGALERVSFDFAVLPNGAGVRGLQQYRAVAPKTADVVFPIDLSSDGDVIEFLIDNLSISRLDRPAGSAP